jgi:hypothetical protein
MNDNILTVSFLTFGDTVKIYFKNKKVKNESSKPDEKGFVRGNKGKGRKEKRRTPCHPWRVREAR